MIAAGCLQPFTGAGSSLFFLVWEELVLITNGCCLFSNVLAMCSEILIWFFSFLYLHFWYKYNSLIMHYLFWLLTSICWVFFFLLCVFVSMDMSDSLLSPKKGPGWGRWGTHSHLETASWHVCDALGTSLTSPYSWPYLSHMSLLGFDFAFMFSWQKELKSVPLYFLGEFMQGWNDYFLLKHLVNIVGQL